MDQIRHFQDEWLIRWAIKLPSVSLAWIAELKRNQLPFLSQVLVDAGLASPEWVYELYERHWRIPAWEPSADAVDPAVLELIPAKVCCRHFLLPFRRTEGTIDIAMANPLDPCALDDIVAYARLKPVVHFSLPGRLYGVIHEVFRPAVSTV